ncbi:MAG: Tm-1-like ATP-binding domain-containing protein [Zestosphaera sp.]
MGSEAPGVLVMGIADTKGPELKFLIELVKRAGGKPIFMELTASGKPAGWADISIEDVAREAGITAEELSRITREKAAEYIVAGGVKIARKLYEEGKIRSAIAFGGSLGTSMASRIMRALPYGVGKFMLSTMASGDVRPYVDIKDLAMWYPLAEKGINVVTAKILATAAGAAVGAAKAPEPGVALRPLIGYTMFGTTTPCVKAVSEHFEQRGYDSMILHAVGTGGRSLEELIRDGFIEAVADITTHELTDLVCGGILSAGPERLTAAGEKGIPQVVSTGGADMINFGPREEVKGKKSLVTGREFEVEEAEGLPGRRIHVHHPMVTVVGTLPVEARRLAQEIAIRLNKSKGPTALVVPMRGWSAYDIREPSLELGWAGPGSGPFWASHQEKPEWSLRSVAFVDELSKHLDLSRENLDLIICDKHINEKDFGLLIAGILDDMLTGRWKKGSYFTKPWTLTLSDFKKLNLTPPQ